VVQFACHPEQAPFAQREPGLSEVEGDPGEPRDSQACPEQAQRVEGRSLRRNNRAFGSLPYQTAPLPGEPSAGRAD
jgi:hypothetical protein